MDFMSLISAAIQAVPATVDLVRQATEGPKQKAALDAALTEFARASGFIPSNESVSLSPQEIADASSATASARYDALSGLRKMSNAGGMDDASRNALREAQMAAEQNQASSRATIESEMRQRGAAGTPASYLMQMGASADANNQLSGASYQAAADARKRALEAMVSTGTLANQIDEAERARQEFNAKMRQAAQVGNAQNAIQLGQQRYGAAADKYGATTGNIAAKDKIDDDLMQAGYGLAGQAGGVTKSIFGGKK